LENDLITVREAARILFLSERTVSRYREEGRLPCHKFSKRKYLYKRKDIEEFLKKSYQEIQLSMF